MAEEQEWHEASNHVLCANNCGFFGSPTTLNLCSKCYKDHCLKEQQMSEAKLAVEKSLHPPPDLIISYRKVDSDDPFNRRKWFYLYQQYGKCLAKVKAMNGALSDDCICSGNGGTTLSGSRCKCNSKKQVQARWITSSVAEALEDIIALFYDEEHNEIYTDAISSRK